jgi:hypothetical protein
MASMKSKEKKYPGVVPFFILSYTYSSQRADSLTCSPALLFSQAEQKLTFMTAFFH